MIKWGVQTSIYFFSNKVSYMILKKKYLIEKKPEKSIKNLFINNSVSKQFSKYSSEDSKKINQDKYSFRNQFKQVQKQQKLQLEQKLKEYKLKYQLPFTRITTFTLFLSKLSKQNNGSSRLDSSQTEIKKSGAQMYNDLSQEQLNKLKQQAALIRIQRNKQKNQFLFPQNKYVSIISYLYFERQKAKKENSILDKQKAKKQYQKYVEQWKQDVTKWLQSKQYRLTIDQFCELYEDAKQSEKKNSKNKKIHKKQENDW